MADASTVRVRGRASRRVRPDRAEARFSIECQAHTVAAATAELEQRWGRLDAVLGEHAAAIERREATWLTVTPRLWLDHQTGEQRRDGHIARRSITVVVGEVEGLGPFLHDVTHAVPDVALHGPWWQVDDANPVHDEARAAAAADAVRRAHAYARGLGATVGAVVRVAEPDVADLGGGAGGLAPVALGRALTAEPPAPDGGAVLDVSDEETEVVAEVVVEMRLG